MIVLGLTGSIGMGKSTTARMFFDAGIPVWDADAVVHKLYEPGGSGAAAIAEIAPEAVTAQGVDRSRLRALVIDDPVMLSRIEDAIHPLVAEDRRTFIEAAKAQGHPIVLCDIPLLFETRAELWLDRVVVVTAPEEVQRQRVLERPGMTEAQLESILAKQLPDAEKRRRADFVIDTSLGMAAARRQVDELIEELSGER